MFENLFNKNAPSPAPSAMQSTADTSANDAQPAESVSADEITAWSHKISAAAADDAALLSLLQAAPTLPLKLATIAALTHEESLRRAMHEVREQDKRLYRAARVRWETLSGTRIATEEATKLIAGARALLEQELVPVNRVVELDRAWAAVDLARVDSLLSNEFASLSSRLGDKVRSHGEHAQAVTRWLAATERAMDDLNARLAGVAQGIAPDDEAQAPALTLLELLQRVPDTGDSRCVAKTDAGNRLLALASSVVQRAKFLQTLPAAGTVGEAEEKQFIEQWRGFPEMSEGELHAVLASRFADWRNAETQKRQHEQDTQTAQQREKRAEQNKQRVMAIERDIDAAETAHAGGHVADLTRLLASIDQALKRGPVSAALTLRIEVLRAEQRRLHDWQRWSGGQGREQLVSEAQALAQEAAGKINLKTHGDAINKLRERWKEIDKLGGASPQAQWLAFDGALETAYAPLAAHLEKLKVARQENLAARDAIIAALHQAATRCIPAPQDNVAAATPDWRAVAHALEESQVAWRKLGPVEHTVPRKALQGEKAVTTRYAAAVQALEAPLKQQYGDARNQREQLITEAKALAASDVAARDVVDKVRKLQGQWQSVAKRLPLPRRDENALWAAFKSATDAIFTARDAARAAAEAEGNAQQQARIDIIERVSALARATAAADIKRGLTEADTAWRAAPSMPRQHAAKLEARYRAARDAAAKRIGDLATHAAQARYDALIAAMALCHEREALQASAALTDQQLGDLQTRWDALADLPDPWKIRVDARFKGAATTPAAVKSGKKSPETLPDILLNLEIGCGIDTPAEFQAARQLLKIRALKDAMEGRQQNVTKPADIERWLLDAAAWPGADTGDSERLSKIIAAVRRRPG